MFSWGIHYFINLSIDVKTLYRFIDLIGKNIDTKIYYYLYTDMQINVQIHI